MMPLLRIADLVIEFHAADGVVRAVNGASMDILQGETVALAGESGCGKSVTALSVMRLLPGPTARVAAGQILFDGRDLLRASEGEMRAVRGADIAMIFQEPVTSLNPVLTVGRQITEQITRHTGKDRRQAQDWAIELLRRVGMPRPESRVNDYPHQLSGGMRQRVMIAMAVSCRPRLIIADEPTTALDPTVQDQVLEVLAGLCRETGAALLLITHNLGLVARYAHRVNIMYAGDVVENGRVADVFRRPAHPYTLGLLRSMPRLSGPRSGALQPIPGQPTDPAALPSGCPFHPRCAYAMPVCRSEYPRDLRISEEHTSKCWIAEELSTGSPSS
ncbi:MAG: ABC transporter ATP-binding protein [Chloroflexota bacterium]